MHKQTHTSIENYFDDLAAKEAKLERRLLATQGKIGARELWRFGITTVVLFLVAFTGLNYSAYEKQLSFWWEQEGQALAADMLGTEVMTDERNEEIAIVPEAAATQSRMPTLALPVTPTENYVFIPRLDIRAPIQQAEAVEYLGDWNYVEDQIQQSLRHGVVHFPGTAQPGELGNAFLTGHSSYYPWDEGRYKDIFALLPQAEIGDEVEVVYGQDTHTYRITEMKEVKPNETDVLRQTDSAQLTLMTCTPVGTALKRLIVTAELVEGM